MTNIYALYKGEDLLATGTTKEICEELNIKASTLYYYNSPTYMKRVNMRKHKRNFRELIILDESEG